MSTYNYRHTFTNLKTGQVKVLDAAPDGWDKVIRRYKRALVYHGILRSDSTPQKVRLIEASDKAGYQFLYDAYQADGIKALVSYKREKRNPYQLNKYDFDISGVIEFTPESGFKIIEDDSIEFKMIDSSKLQSFISNDEKNIKLSSTTAINGNAITPFTNTPIQCTYPKIDFFLYAETFGTTQMVNVIAIATGIINGFYRYNEVINYLGDRFDKDDGVNMYVNNTDNTINLNIVAAGTYSGSFEYNPSNPSNFATVNQDLVAEIYDGSGVLTSTITYWTEDDSRSSLGSTTTHNYSGSFSNNDTVNIEAGGKVIFKLVTNVVSLSNITIRFNLDTDYNPVNYTENYLGRETTKEPTWYPLETGQRAIQVMTGEADTNKLLYAPIFGRTNSEFQTYPSDGRASRLGIIGGRVLKRTPNAETIINFRDWFKTTDRLENIALYYDNNSDYFVIVDKEDVYKNIEIFNVGEVSGLHSYPYDKMLFSQLLTGMREKGEYDKVQGIHEEHIASEHSTDMPVKTKLDLQTPYNLDSIGIEFQRRAQIGEDGLKDTKQDEHTFMVQFNSSNVAITNADIGGFGGYKGINQRYNGNYTPRQNLERQGNWITSQLIREAYSATTGYKFENNTKDLNISYGGTNEQDFLSVLEMDKPLFYPDVYEFDGVVTDAMITQLRNDPHGYVTFSYKGVEKYGFILSLEFNEFDRKGSFKLLRANRNR